MEGSAMLLRPARPADQDALYEVALRTGDGGADGTDLFDDSRILGDVYVGPYLNLEPRLAFTLDIEGPAGYLLAALDTPDFENRCSRSWWPILRERYPLTAKRRATDAELVSLIHQPPTRPADLVSAYPSHLHIDLLPRVQGQGYGPRMLATMLTVLADAGSSGVHLGVAPGNSRAQRVYRALGFDDWQLLDDELVMVRALP